MGRPPKNPDNRLTRLRKQLSTPNIQMTRIALAKLTGIPLDTIKDIETGRFKLTEQTVIRVAVPTGADCDSLLKGDDPIVDVLGKPLNANSYKFVDILGVGRTFGDTIKLLFSIALEAAQESNRSTHFYLLFRGWISKTAQTLRIEKKITEKLHPKIASIHPDLNLPTAFYPDDPKQKSLWEFVLSERRLKHQEKCAEIRENFMAEHMPRKFKRLKDLRSMMDQGEALSAKQNKELESLEMELSRLGATATSLEVLRRIDELVKASTTQLIDSDWQDWALRMRNIPVRTKISHEIRLRSIDVSLTE
jgi:hypothetical protein